jgi:hypothetical protein
LFLFLPFAVVFGLEGAGSVVGGTGSIVGGVGSVVGGAGSVVGGAGSVVGGACAVGVGVGWEGAGVGWQGTGQAGGNDWSTMRWSGNERLAELAGHGVGVGGSAGDSGDGILMSVLVIMVVFRMPDL